MSSKRIIILDSRGLPFNDTYTEDGPGQVVPGAYVPGVGIYPVRGANLVTDSTTGQQYCDERAVEMRECDLLYYAATTTNTVSGNTADLAVAQYSEICVDVTVANVLGTSPTLQFKVDRKMADGVNYVTIASGTSITAAGSYGFSVGTGMQNNQSLGQIIRIRWSMGGTSPSFDFDISCYAK